MSRAMDALAVFDIDGTLTQTALVDEECYGEAIRQEWGITGISTDWGAYQHSTDNAIATEVSRVHRGRDATQEELAALRDRFVALLRTELERSPDRFRATPGAVTVTAALPRNGWQAAIATGGWTPSARLKLAAAGVPLNGVPAAFACDALPREEIIRLAIRRAEDRAGRRFERVVYVGDGTWDLRASRSLGIGFVGIGNGERAERLRAAGAREVLEDMVNLVRLVAALDAAAARPAAVA